VRYTARDGGAPLKSAATTALRQAMEVTEKAPLMRLFSVRHEFPTGWYGFLHPKGVDDQQAMLLDLGPNYFPYQYQGKALAVQRVEAFVKLKDGASAPPGFDLFLSTPALIAAPDLNTDKLSLESKQVLRGLLQGGRDVESNAHGTWRLWARKADPTPLVDLIDDIFLVFSYSIQAK
jgi:hypothetical protein